MAGLSEAEVAQLYNGIYGPATQGPAPLPTLTLEQMYRGIYGPASAAPAPTPPAPPAPPAPPQAPNGYQGPDPTSAPGSFPQFGSLLDMFPGSSQTRTAQAEPAAVVASGYGSGNMKADNERLLPSGGLPEMFGQPPTTRRVQSVPMGQTQIASNNIALPRTRPDHTSAASALAGMFAPSASQPLEILVDGSNTIRSSYAPTPARRSVAAPVPARRTVAPAPVAAPAPAASPAQWMTDGAAAVRQSGDYSSGNQAEYAANRASAQSYRDAQERKR